MKPYHGIYLYTDLDGTLLQDDKTVSDADYAALCRFIDGGGNFGIATGRPLPHIARFRDRLPITAPCVLCNGAAVYDFSQEQYLRLFPLDKDLACQTIHQVEALLPDISVQIFTEQTIYMVNPHQRDDLYIIWDNLPRVHLLPEQIEVPFWKILFCHRGQVLDETVPKLHLAPTLVTYRSEETYFEVLAQAKGGALESLRPSLPGCHTLLTIGDYENDLSLLAAGDVCAAPANALPCVRQAADMQVPDNNHHAVAAFLQQAVFSRYESSEKGREA